MSKILRFLSMVVVVAVCLAVGFYFFYMAPRYTVPILMYHGVSDVLEDSLYVSPENFEKQMRYLSSKKYKVISLDEYVQNIKDGKITPKRTVIITFDDGFEDNYTNAFPILADYEFPATIFIITDYVGKKSDYLNWNQIRFMAKHGISFGAHTKSNVYLPNITDVRELWDEIMTPRIDIKKEAALNAKYFCYPTGGFTEKAKNAVIKAGYTGACTTNRGKDKYNKDIFELKRVKVTNSDTTKPFHFKAKLSGYYNFFRSLKQGS